MCMRPSKPRPRHPRIKAKSSFTTAYQHIVGYSRPRSRHFRQWPKAAVRMCLTKIAITHNLPTAPALKKTVGRSPLLHSQRLTHETKARWSQDQGIPPLKCTWRLSNNVFSLQHKGKCPFSTFCCTMWSQSTNDTDRRTSRSKHKRDMLIQHIVLKWM